MKKTASFLFISGAFLLAFAFRFIEIRVTEYRSAQNQRVVKTRFAIRCGLTDFSDLADVPALPGWGNYQWKITTSSDSAQFYFNQGINMYYAFHTIESHASFEKAIRFDSTCAMAWYGKALAYGPTINYGNGFRAPVEAINAAIESGKWKSSCSPLEKDLIDAISQRYSPDTTADLKNLQVKYSDAMQRLSLNYPRNADVLTLYADALMLEHPWDLYDHDLNPKPWTPKIRGVLDQALAVTPRHPGANHYRVHTLEGSRHPEDALVNAETLSTLMPGVAHLVHMPSHIFIRTGDYHKGIVSNDNALLGYNQYARIYAPVQNDAVLYQLHAIHLKFACALAAGNYATAVKTGDTLDKLITPDYFSVGGPMGNLIQYAYASRLFADIRFGKWEDVLKRNGPDSLPYSAVLMHFARGLAFLHLDHVAEADHELQLLKNSMQAKVLKEPFDPFSSAYDACRVAEHILTGALLEKKHHYQASEFSFKKAVDAEDLLVYNEPRDWLLPARQYLGNLYLKTGRYKEAVKVFTMDLVINPKNGWSLTGLQTAYTALKNHSALNQVNKELADAWQIRDVPVNAPVFQ